MNINWGNITAIIGFCSFMGVILKLTIVDNSNAHFEFMKQGMRELKESNEKNNNETARSLEKLDEKISLSADKNNKAITDMKEDVIILKQSYKSLHKRVDFIDGEKRYHEN